MPTEIKQANMLKEIISNRKLIWDLSKNDFKTRFAGSYLGIIWAFVQPIVTVLVYWFVFEKGMHASGINLRSGITAPFCFVADSRTCTVVFLSGGAQWGNKCADGV